MSVDAQNKYKIKHWVELNFDKQVVEGDNFFYKPYQTRTAKDYTAFYDEFGYRNPPGYITQHHIDTVLLGDSFIEGKTKTTVAEYLREFLAPWKIYSLGMGGQGPPHWKMQFRRYVNSTYFKSAPKAVVLNFYSGNDIIDTLSYEPGKVDIGYLLAGKPNPPQRKLSFFNELIAIARYVVYYRKFLASYKQVEPLLEDMSNPAIVQALSEVVQEIRIATKPLTIILLSYIATPASIYGPDVDRCLSVTRAIAPSDDFSEACENDADRQVVNSNFLRNLAVSLKIEYLDPTPVLRQTAEGGGNFTSCHGSTF